MTAGAASDAAAFLLAPGRNGAMGALLDEYARAAVDFCRVVESFDARRFEAKHPSPDPSTVSPHLICAHVCAAARAYADYIRKARGLPHVDAYRLEPERLRCAADVRPQLVAALHYTEGAVEGLHDATEEQVGAIRFQVRWGPTFDPDMLLEHAICHLLRHRRQLERWPRPADLSAGT